MKNHFFVLFFSIWLQSTALATLCNDGFTLVNNKCLRLITSDYTRENARQQCNLLGGNIVSIYNSIDNTAIAQFSTSSADPIWIGLKCSVDHDPSNCLWDDQLGNASTYNNFIAGNPVNEIGSCVYMLTSGSLRGRWLSGQCDSTQISAVCESDPIGKCTYQYNNNCYYPIGELAEPDALNACKQNCAGGLVSIHSAAENAFIASLFTDPSKHYIRIGAQLSTRSCYSLSMINEVAAPGKWISSNCSLQLPSICKWKSGSSCIAPTLAPSQCTSPVYLSDSGTIYSPNYPYSYTSSGSNPCYYIITVSSYNAVLWFDELILDSKSTIELYSSLDSSTPFSVIDQTTQSNYTSTILSPTNVIKIVFKPCTSNCDQSINYKWKAKFGRQYNTICGSWQNTNGYITSPGYPNNYPNSYACDYYLQNPSGRIQIHFDSFNTEYGHDYLSIYNGQSSSYTRLAALSGLYGSNTNLTFTSSSNYLYMTFRTDSDVAFSGFSARFYSYP
ncbi:unnamed protein product [Caenorhabditis angaria]|uniref:CUB domain-containing protein n=1 Tax=Caenorhabditis angaria TaxID=860376 RepID=A0A9P1N7G0_9PELO|nr:unnamed protein product [Caenorhabditis angaria]